MIYIAILISSLAKILKNIIFRIFLFASYSILVSIHLNKTHKIKYGEKSDLAWFPLTDTYILGKVTVNKLFGIFLTVISLIPNEFSIHKDGKLQHVTLFPKFISIILSIGVICLDIYMIIRSYQLQKQYDLENNITEEDIIIEEKLKKLHSKDYIVDPRTGMIILKSEKSPAMTKEETKTIDNMYQDIVKPTGVGLQIDAKNDNVLDTFNFDIPTSQNMPNNVLEKQEPKENNLTIMPEEHINVDIPDTNSKISTERKIMDVSVKPVVKQQPEINNATNNNITNNVSDTQKQIKTNEVELFDFDFDK